MCSVQAIIDQERITDDFHWYGGCWNGSERVFCLMSGMFWGSG